MSRVLAAVFACAFTVVLIRQMQAATPPRKAKTSTGVSGTRHVVGKSASHRVSTGSRVVRGRYGRKTVVRTSAPSYQVHPDEDRYREIQKALAERGFYKGEVNGQWTPDSVDALKRFQADQKLEADGRINSHSLIGLGLGPKHDGSTASSVPAAAMTPADAPPTPESGAFPDPDRPADHESH